MTYQLYPVGYASKNKRPATLHSGGTRFPVGVDDVDSGRVIGSNAWALIDEHCLTPPTRAIELHRLALLVYAADTRIPRRLAFNGWERDLVVHVPVADTGPWFAARDIVKDLLSFLTGDRWRVEFFLSKRPRPSRDEKLWKKGSRTDSDAVSLFSGGLDSLIGASDLLAAGTSPLLVGHCDSPSTSAVQSEVVEALRAKYPAAGPLLQFWIRPPYLIDGEKEETTRGRSFLFFSLATLVASGLGRASRLFVPENGFIALNAPLTGTRLGSLSTRTVHPYTVARYRALLKALGIAVEVQTPYAFATKGEMLEQAANRKRLKAWAPLSMSCAHATAGRWRGLDPFKHCGRCVPCIIRRASLHHVGWDDPSEYITDVLTVSRQASNLQDVRAFLTAIERRHTMNPAVAVLRSGPIPNEAGSVAEYASVYSRGLEEVERFLSQRKTRRL